jgi:hypothetical protein
MALVNARFLLPQKGGRSAGFTLPPVTSQRGNPVGMKAPPWQAKTPPTLSLRPCAATLNKSSSNGDFEREYS